MILSDFVLRKQKRACAMRRATSDTAFKMACRDRWMHRAARLGVNQGEAEGVDFRPRLKLNPPICSQDCPRGAAAGRFLWDGCVKFGINRRKQL